MPLNKFLFILILNAFIPALSHAESIISITSGRGEPFVNSQQNGFYDQIVKQMFQRINVKAKTISLPSERSLINANTGIDD
ncbi:hypothetical protein MNBD_GAMMA08-2397, partial [hydrothermal vent metagenome]